MGETGEPAEPADPEKSLAELSDALFAHQDAARNQKWDALLADCAEACDTAQRAYDARY